ncbi:hypothetical protein [Methylomonas albis]|uniref:DUF697 domain-containing protein n=1 Tax=Methylomonas albis TaxID=1854563 RepID=A0ABR9D4N1_9GAMM|nr:DUF697 domain-containing protein [Methylomonas albis]MBD9358035.1 DUF697 domain-containing protein [Methylomonas albis]CAD6881387.1 hypothetical protein [Methylomonas albis]
MNATVTEEATLLAETVIDADATASPIIKRYSLIAAGIGIIPVPLIDSVLVSGVQVKMVYELAKAFDTPFIESRVKAIVGSLVGGIAPIGVAGGAVHLVKAIPFIGFAAWYFVGPALAFASTYAVGKVFSEHFQTGGTLLTFNADKIRVHYQREFEAALKSRKAGKTPA